MNFGINTNPGELSISYQVLSGLYNLALSVDEDSTFAKDDILNDVKNLIAKMKELIESLEAN